MTEKDQITERKLDEFNKRKSVLEKKHEMELKSLEARQKREIDALSARYSAMIDGKNKKINLH